MAVGTRPHPFIGDLRRPFGGRSVVTPNLAVKPATVMIAKITIKVAKQAVRMFGPAQATVAKAVADSVVDSVIPKGQCEELVIVGGVFIRWEAARPQI